MALESSRVFIGILSFLLQTTGITETYRTPPNTNHSELYDEEGSGSVEMTSVFHQTQTSDVPKTRPDREDTLPSWTFVYEYNTSRAEINNISTEHPSSPTPTDDVIGTRRERHQSAGYSETPEQETSVGDVVTVAMSMDGPSWHIIIGVITMIVIIILFTSALIYFMKKYQMDLFTVFRIIRNNFTKIITCRYRSSANYNSNVTVEYCHPKSSVNTCQRSVGRPASMIATESVLDLSKLDSSASAEDGVAPSTANDDFVPRNPVSRDQYVSNYDVNDNEQIQQITNEFEKIRKWSKHLPFCSFHAKLEKNRPKNRYSDIIPFDYNRVPLYDKPGMKGLEPYQKMTPEERANIPYINASYIHEFGSRKMKYIAAQGPLSGTIIDFWEMAWQEESDLIVMLTSQREQGKVKCERYWPEEIGELIQCSQISIKMEVFKKYAYHSYRVLEVTKGGVSRQVKHYQYHHWPDKKAPETVLPILNLYKKMFSQRAPRSAPVIVHCSAGVGRTGTFISLDYLQEQAAETNTVDIMGCVSELRRQRLNMVQKLSQYTFLYDAVYEALRGVPSCTPAEYFNKWKKEVEKDDNGFIARQFELLNSKRPACPPENQLIGLEAENRNKNRNLDIIPKQAKIVYLSTFIKGRNAYINAVYVDTFTEMNAMVVTQLPLEETICDFWRLVYDASSTVIVLLEDMVDMPEDCPIFWPEGEATYDNVISVSGKLNTELSNERITVRDFQVTTTQERHYVVNVTMLQMKTWPRGDSVPAVKSDFIELIQMSKKFKKNVLAVQCLDGCERSGLFCACVYITDQISIDQEIDIFQAAQIIMASRPQFIQTKEQFKFLHEFAVEYLKITNTRCLTFAGLSSSKKRYSCRFTKEAASEKKLARERRRSLVYKEDAAGGSTPLRRLFKSENELKEVVNATVASYATRGKKVKPKATTSGSGEKLQNVDGKRIE